MEGRAFFPALKGLFVFLHLILRGKTITVLGVLLSLSGKHILLTTISVGVFTTVNANSLQVGV